MGNGSAFRAMSARLNSTGKSNGCTSGGRGGRRCSILRGRVRVRRVTWIGGLLLGNRSNRRGGCESAESAARETLGVAHEKLLRLEMRTLTL